jgi:hypothetical protein
MTQFLHVAGKIAISAAVLDFRGIGRAITLYRVLRTFDCVPVARRVTDQGPCGGHCEGAPHPEAI